MTSDLAVAPAMLVVWIPTPTDPPPLLNRLTRLHWTYRHRWVNLCAEYVWVAKVAQRPQRIPWEHAILTVTLRYCGTEPDATNLSGVAKVGEDALVRAGIIEDDAPQYLTTGIFAVRVGTRAERGITLYVEEIAG